MFEVKKDPRLERIVRRFEGMDPLLQDYVVKYLDWLMDWYAAAPRTTKGTESPGKKA
jgi:hypothetical protein